MCHKSMSQLINILNSQKVLALFFTHFQNLQLGKPYYANAYLIVMSMFSGQKF